MNKLEYKWLEEKDILFSITSWLADGREKYFFQSGVHGQEWYFIERDTDPKDFDKASGSYCSEDVIWYVTHLGDFSACSPRRDLAPLKRDADIHEVCLWCRQGCPVIKRTTGRAKGKIEWTLGMLKATPIC